MIIITACILILGIALIIVSCHAGVSQRDPMHEVIEETVKKRW